MCANTSTTVLHFEPNIHFEMASKIFIIEPFVFIHTLEEYYKEYIYKQALS